MAHTSDTFVEGSAAAYPVLEHHASSSLLEGPQATLFCRNVDHTDGVQVRADEVRSMAIPLVTPLPRVLRPRRASPEDVVRPTRAEVNLGNLRHNLRVVRRYADSSRIFAVLKADAYGHGAPAVARTLERSGVDGFCVALLEEGIELREAGIRAPIIVMGGYYGRAWGDLMAHRLTPVIYDPGHIQALAREARYYGIPQVDVHLKIDTGMSRLGVRHDAIAPVLNAFAQNPEVRLTGMMTHFSSADEEDLSTTLLQCDRLEKTVRLAQQADMFPQVVHAANSAALMRVPRARYNLVRPGIAIFGVAPRPELATDLRPVMRVSTRIVSIRDIQQGEPAGYCATWLAPRPSRIATIPMGYADGLPRALSNRGRALVRGRSVPIVGNISMDLTMLDVTDIPGVGLNDEAVLLGSQKGPLGADTISADEIAGLVDSISWEILTGISRRVPRFYREP